MFYSCHNFTSLAELGKHVIMHAEHKKIFSLTSIEFNHYQSTLQKQGLSAVI